MKDKQWTTKTNIDKRNRITIPSGYMMCGGYKAGDTMDIICGANFSCVVILPTGIKLNDRMEERIKLLVEETLT